MKNIPDSIFLQIGDADDCDYSDLEGVTFHHKKVFENDIEYIKKNNDMENGKNFTLKWDNKIIAKGVDVIIEEGDMPEGYASNEPDDYDYLFVIADLILNLHLDEMVKSEIPQWCWTNLINTMIEFKKATDRIIEE